MLRLLFALLFLSTTTFAQTDEPAPLTQQQEQTIQDLFSTKGEIYFSFEITSRSEINVFTKFISIDQVQGNTVRAFANEKEFRRFLSTGKAYAILPNPNTQFQGKTTDNPEELLNTWDVYPTYQAYETIMETFAAEHPDLCRLVNIGTLPSGRKLLCIKISDNVDDREDEPQFLYTSSMHGDEIAGYPGMLHYIDYLLTNYGTDSRVTYLVDNMEIWINPLANPDGTYKGGNNTVSGATRSNGNNVDLNRNYPDPQDGPHPDGNNYQPETQAFMAFAESMNFVMAANFHGGAEVVNYPWDTKPELPADTEWWINESKEYADTAKLHSPASYLTSVTQSGVTNGYAWYEVNGGRQDYMNYYHHCREVTVELSNTKLLQENQLLNNWEYNHRSWLNYMEEALHGIRGVVKDACTDLPITASITIEGHDAENSHVVSGLPLGNYHRPVLSGIYDLTFSAPGYESQTVTGVAAEKNVPATVVNVSLQPLPPVAAFAANATDICGQTISFTDLTGSATSWQWTFGDGTFSTEQNPTHTWQNSGTYAISLAVSNCKGTDTLVQNDFIKITIPQSPGVQPATVCVGENAELTATGPGTINWYDVLNGGAPVFTGNPFTTAALNQSTVFYAESDQGGAPQKIGPLDNSIGTGGFYTGGTFHFLRFDAQTSFQLQSVWVNANTAGVRNIQLRDGSGAVMASKAVNIPAGPGRIDLNFDVPAGEGMQLGVAGGNNLYRNLTGAVYPYSIDNVVSITGNSAGNAAVYYYFYDWEIRKICSGPRTPVTVTVETGPAVPIISQIDNTLVSSSSTGNQWYNDNGIIPGATEPVFTPLSEGTYYVVVTDTNGCTAISESVTTLPVGVDAPVVSALEQVRVYPNPGNGIFTIDRAGAASMPVSLTVTDALGKQVYNLPVWATGKAVVDGTGWGPGIYFLKMTGVSGGSRVVRLVIE